MEATIMIRAEITDQKPRVAADRAKRDPPAAY
jgi:hypothetical protein